MGRADEAFALGDLDGDGVLDLIGRGPNETTLWHNDGHGALTVSASGKTPPRPSDQPGGTSAAAPARPSPAVAFMNDGGQQVMVALTPSSANLFRVFTPAGSSSASIQPLVTPLFYLPNGADETLVALLEVNPADVLYDLEDVERAVLQAERQRHHRHALQLLGVRLGKNMGQVPLDVGALCGYTPQAPAKLLPTVRNGALELMMVLDGRYVCLAEGSIYATSASQFTVHVIDAADGIRRLIAGNWNVGFNSTTPVGKATVFDMNGDGRLDVLASLSYIDEPGQYSSTAFLYWIRAADGSFAAQPLYYDEQADQPSSAADTLVTHDLNGDGREDLLFAGHIYQSLSNAPNWPPPPSDSLHRLSSYEYPMVLPTESTVGQLGDINGDQRVDFVQGFGLRSDIIVCRQPINVSGFPTFACDDEPTALAGVDGLTLADVNGDGRNDIVSFGRGTAAWGSPSMLSIVLGGDADANPPAPTLLPGYHASLVAVAPAPSTNAPSGLWLVLHGDDGRYAVARSHVFSDGIVSFGITSPSNDVRVADYDGDGKPDLLLDGSQFVRGPLLDTAYAGNYFSTPPVATVSSHFLDVPGEPLPLEIFQTKIDPRRRLAAAGRLQPDGTAVSDGAGRHAVGLEGPGRRRRRRAPAGRLRRRVRRQRQQAGRRSDHAAADRSEPDPESRDLPLRGCLLRRRRAQGRRP